MYEQNQFNQNQYNHQYDQNQNELINYAPVIADMDNEKIILTDGIYDYSVINIEEGVFSGSEKTPPCGKVHLTLMVPTNEGNAFCHTDLLLTETCYWKICGFLKSIGVMRKGDSIQPVWNDYIGARGKARFAPYHYIDKFGNDKVTNTLIRFIDWDGSLNQN